MRNKIIVSSWDKIAPDQAADAQMLHTILARKRKLYEKQERRDNILLCLIQIVLFVMTISIVVIICIVNQGILGALLIGYTIVGGFISLAILLVQYKKRMMTGGIKSYD